MPNFEGMRFPSDVILVPPLVRRLPAELLAFGSDDGRARRVGQPFDDHLASLLKRAGELRNALAQHHPFSPNDLRACEPPGP